MLQLYSILFSEMRVKGAFRMLREKYPNIPEYVFRDIYWVSNKNDSESGEHTTAQSVQYLEWVFEKFNQARWKKQVIEVTPFSFDEGTRKHMESRGFGTINLDQIPRDAERMDIQSKLVRGDGKNEPVILTVGEEEPGKYSLHEGWHRTMNVLKLGKQPDGSWTPVLLQAWIGYPPPSGWGPSDDDDVPEH